MATQRNEYKLKSVIFKQYFPSKNVILRFWTKNNVDFHQYLQSKCNSKCKYVTLDCHFNCARNCSGSIPICWAFANVASPIINNSISLLLIIFLLS